MHNTLPNVHLNAIIPLNAALNIPNLSHRDIRENMIGIPFHYRHVVNEKGNKLQSFKT